MRTLITPKTRNGGPSLLLALFAGIGLAMGLAVPGTRAAANNWKKLEGAHKETPRAELLRILQKDGVKDAEALLGHPFLLRLEFRDAGGGSARHSEVVVRFRSLPAKVMAKAWTPGGQEPGRAQLGAYSECKEKQGAVGRSCPLEYNGRGFVDVTSFLKDRNILFVHDPARKGQGYTVLWFASDQSQEHLWHYVVPKTGFPSFGFGRLSVKKYRVPKPEPLARLPGDPPDPTPRPGPGPTPGPTPDPRPLPPPDRPVGPGPSPDPTPDPGPGPSPGPRPLPPPDRPAMQPRPGVWVAVNALHTDMDQASLRRRLRAEGVAYPDHLLNHRYVARVALTDAGGGSRSRSELQLRLVSQPAKALGKAWADQPGLQRGQIGAEDLCQSLPGREGGPESKRCPMHFGGLGWRNLITAFRSVRMRLVVDPNNNDAGHMVIWLAFDQPQTGMAYRLVNRSVLPSLGGGKVNVDLFGVSQGEGPGPGPGPAPDPGPGPAPNPGPGPTPTPAPQAGWTSLGAAPRAESRASLEIRMQRDGVGKPAHLLGHAYVVRLSIAGAGGPEGRRSEAVLRLSSLPKAALGKAWSDHRQGWGAQMGALSRCRRLPKPQNPYGDDQDWVRRPEGHVCPLQYNGLGWRDLVSGITETEVMFVTAPHQTGKGNQLLWLAFSEPPRLQLRPASSRTALFARVTAESFTVGDASAPGPGPAPGVGPAPGPTNPEDPDGGPDTGPAPRPTTGPETRWIDQPGSHQQVEKNALYWTVRRDGVDNPWHLLKTRYLVRLEVTGESTERAETLVRFSAAPREAIGKGTGPNRSATQAGTEEACRKTPGQPAFCPLHYAGIGWRNLVSSLGGRTLLFVTDPGRGQGGAGGPTTILWLAFDAPQDRAAVQYATSVQGRAQVKIQRYRW